MRPIAVLSRCLLVVLLSAAGIAAQAEEARAPIDDLLAVLRRQGSADQLEAMRAFAARPDAPQAIAPLLERIRAEAPALDNNGCLALEFVLRAHPTAVCPVAPLLEVLARPIWTSRQKAAQALLPLLRDDVVAAHREALARAVIPLLTSQRSRVYRAGAACLAKIAGKDLGDDPVAARAWFHATFDSGLDLTAAVHERVLIVRPAGGGWAIGERQLSDDAALTEAVRAERERAAGARRSLGVVLQVAAGDVDALLAGGDSDRLARPFAALRAAGVDDATIAPDSDVFRAPFVDPGVPAALLATLGERLAALAGDRVPGAQAAIVLPDGRLAAFAHGVADRATGAPMPVDGRMLAGSTGKTFFAALALQLVREGRLDLDAKVAQWLGGEPWFARVPNAGGVTVRHLMSHRSGVMRYELTKEFLHALGERPEHRFTPVEEVAFVLDRAPRFAAGEGFDYSDTNYVLLGMILERITGGPCYAEIERRFLEPLRLADTVPGVGRRIPRLVQGHAGEHNVFGGRDRMLVDGELPFDAGFEGAGGGFASTAADLARWAAALYGGDVLAGVREQALDGRPAPLGPGARYGLGVMIDRTELGPAVGHSGFFPGWMSAMRYFPEVGVAAAVIVNSSAEPRLGAELVAWTVDLARAAVGG